MENVDEQKTKEAQLLKMAEEISEMTKVDQDMRKRVMANKGIVESKEDETLDNRNMERMREIVEQIGWPTISKVGKEASTDAWLLVQHADHNVKFQRYCLNLMKGEPADEVDLHDIAYLEDRVRINSGQPQLYGTQFRWTADNKPIQDIEDPENFDVRRKEMGLKTLAENLEEMYEKYNIPKPTP